MQPTLLPFQSEYQPRQWISISELKSFARCPRKFYYQVGCGLTGQDFRIAMDFGTAIHCGAPLAESNQLDAAIEAFKSSWNPTGHESLGDKKRNLDNGIAILHNLRNQFHGPSASWELIKFPPIYEVEDISPWEVPFVADLPGCPIPIVGRMDGLCRSKIDGNLWVREYKTTSQMGSSFFQSFEFGCQSIGYTWAARQVLTQHLRDLNILSPTSTISGTAIIGIKVCAKSQDVITLPITVTDEMISAWVSWASDLTSRILHCESNKNFPQYPSGCNAIDMFGTPSYGSCEYINLCKYSNPSSLRGLYQTSRHLPFTALKELITDHAS